MISESATPARRKRDPRYRKQWVVLYIVSVLLGLFVIVQDVTGEFESARLLAFVWAIGLTMWVATDARLYRNPLPTMSLWVVFLLLPIAAPVCMVRAGGWLRLVWFLLHAAGWVTLGTTLNALRVMQ